MENNLDRLEKIMLKESERFTPEYFKEMALKSYKEDREYPENFSNWYPHIKSFGKFAHTDIISNQIFTFEEVQAMQETDNLSEVDWGKLNDILKPTLDKMQNNTLYNIKNGCFSNKFDFETCICDKHNLAEQLWKINYQSCMFSTGGETELVVRKYIPSYPNENLLIYNGMPLRVEVRVFYNMDTEQIEYMEDYWNYDYCSKNIRNLNDRIIFDIFHNKFDQSGNELLKYTCNHEEEFNRVSKIVQDNISTLKFDGELKGIWSIDFMYQDELDKIYLIDMARGFRSAYWNPDKLCKETQDKLKE